MRITFTAETRDPVFEAAAKAATGHFPNVKLVFDAVRDPAHIQTRAELLRHALSQLTFS